RAMAMYLSGCAAGTAALDPPAPVPACALTEVQATMPSAAPTDTYGCLIVDPRVGRPIAAMPASPRGATPGGTTPVSRLVGASCAGVWKSATAAAPRRRAR